MATNKSALEATMQSRSDFHGSFCKKVKTSCFINDEIAVLCVFFSENYYSIIQGFHWKNAQATPRLFGANYSQNEMTGHINFVVTSYCLKHDAVAVHLFQSKLCSFLCVWFKDLLFWCCLKVKKQVKLHQSLLS
jgi:hypothetical protein